MHLHAPPYPTAAPIGVPGMPSSPRRGIMAGALAALSLGLSGCWSGPSTQPNVAPLREGVRFIDDLSYGPAERHQLGLYHPVDTPSVGGWPVIVAFHGGFWQTGSRDEWQMHLCARQLAERGTVVILANYRLYPEVTFPGFVEDGARAVEWASRNVAQFGGNRDAIFTAGHSAGGHIAVMLAMDDHFLTAHGIRLAGAIGIAGPYGTWFQENFLVSGVFPVELRLESSPIALAHASAPPLLLIGAGLDVIVRPSDSTELAERVRHAGGQARSIIYPLASHTSIIMPPPFGPDGVVADVCDFIQAALGRKTPAA